VTPRDTDLEAVLHIATADDSTDRQHRLARRGGRDAQRVAQLHGKCVHGLERSSLQLPPPQQRAQERPPRVQRQTVGVGANQQLHVAARARQTPRRRHRRDALHDRLERGGVVINARAGGATTSSDTLCNTRAVAPLHSDRGQRQRRDAQVPQAQQHPSRRVLKARPVHRYAGCVLVTRLSWPRVGLRPSALRYHMGHVCMFRSCVEE
jgi:hypothetical protein